MWLAGYPQVGPVWLPKGCETVPREIWRSPCWWQLPWIQVFTNNVAATLYRNNHTDFQKISWFPVCCCKTGQARWPCHKNNHGTIYDDCRGRLATGHKEETNGHNHWKPKKDPRVLARAASLQVDESIICAKKKETHGDTNTPIAVATANMPAAHHWGSPPGFAEPIQELLHPTSNPQLPGSAGGSSSLEEYPRLRQGGTHHLRCSKCWRTSILNSWKICKKNLSIYIHQRSCSCTFWDSGSCTLNSWGQEVEES